MTIRSLIAATSKSVHALAVATISQAPKTTPHQHTTCLLCSPGLDNLLVSFRCTPSRTDK